MAIERLTIRLEYVEKALDALDTDGINADELDEEIDALRTSLNASWGLDIKDLENRLNIIELILDSLEKKAEVSP